MTRAAVYIASIAAKRTPTIDNLPDQLSDDDLIQAVGRGETGALRVLLERHQNKLRRLARYVLQDFAAADDAVQDAFVKVFRSARRFKPSGGAASWLYRITMNVCRDQLRRRKRRAISLEQLPIELAAAGAPDAMETDETIQAVRQAVGQLPERQRTALVLHRYEQLSHDQIVEITGWSRSAVESLLVRAYESLRRSLAPLVQS